MRVLRATGEYPSVNELTIPEGAARTAVNVVVDQPSEYNAHRGLQASAASGRPLSAFTLFRDVLIAHSQEDGILLKLESGTWTEYSGSYSAPGDDGVMSFQESGGALFFTTTLGVFRLDSPSATPQISGLPQALPGIVDGALVGSGVALADNSATAYRVNWAFNTDAGGNLTRLVEGAPSPRLVVVNTSGGTVDVPLKFPIPDNLPTGAYFRLFRADAVPASILPLDEMRQVFERQPTTTEIAAGEFSVLDVTPDTVKGNSAYWSANTGAGIAFANYRAPLVLGLSSFSESTFGVGVSGVQRFVITLLGTDDLTTANGLTFTRGLVTETYTAAASEVFPDQFEVFTGGVPAEDTANTVASLVRAINSRAGGFLRAFSIDPDGSQPGIFIVEARDLDQTRFSIEAVDDSTPFLPRLNATVSALSGDVTRSAGIVTVSNIVHGLFVGDVINLQNDYSSPGDATLFPPGLKTVATTPMPDIFTYVEAGADGTNAGSFSYKTTNYEATSDDGIAENAFTWSKRFEPDHWPLPNLDTVGGATDKLLWSQPLDRWNFLGSEAGLYRINGNADDGFANPEGGAPWDSTTRFIGRRNHAVLGGQAFALAGSGIVVWSEASKPRNVDGPIQREIRDALTAYPTALARYGFFFADEIHRRLYVAMPESADATSATLVRVLSFPEGGPPSWSRLTTTFPGFEDGALAGMAPESAGGVMYALPAGDDRVGTVLTTRTTASAADFQGPEGQGLACKVTYMPWTAGEPERFKMWTWTRIFTQQPTTRITYGYATDLIPTEQTQTLPDIDPVRIQPIPVVDPLRALAWPTIVGNEPGNSYMRGRSFAPSVAHSEPAEEFRLLGVEVKHRAYGAGQM